MTRVENRFQQTIGATLWTEERFTLLVCVADPMDVLPPEMHMEIIARCDRQTLGHLGQANRAWWERVQPALCRALEQGICVWVHGGDGLAKSMTWEGQTTEGNIRCTRTSVILRDAAGFDCHYSSLAEHRGQVVMTSNDMKDIMTHAYLFAKSLSTLDRDFLRFITDTYKNAAFHTKVHNHLAAYPSGGFVVYNYYQVPGFEHRPYMLADTTVFFVNDMSVLMDEMYRVSVIARRNGVEPLNMF